MKHIWGWCWDSHQPRNNSLKPCRCRLLLQSIFPLECHHAPTPGSVHLKRLFPCVNALLRSATCVSVKSKCIFIFLTVRRPVDIGTLSRHSCGKGDLWQDIRRENTISTSSHFPFSAQRSWRWHLWWMRGHLLRREVRLDAGTCWQPDVICLMLWRYCFNNDRVSFCRISFNEKVPVQQSQLGNSRTSSKGKNRKLQ